MNFDWQIVATVGFIAIAVVIVLRRLLKLFSTPASGCGSGCSGCAKQGAPVSGATDGFVSLDALAQAGAAVHEKATSN